MEPILVTGGTGNLGRELVAQLARRGHQVRVATRTPESFAPPSPQVEAVRFDYDHPETFAPALQGVRRLFLVARPLDPGAFEALSPFIEAARESGVERIVFNSALGVDLNEAAPLRRIERQLESTGLSTCFLRPNFFMENFSTGFASGMIREHGALFLPAEGAATSFISTVDIAEVAAAALLSDSWPHPELNLTGDQALDHHQVAALIAKAAGHQVSYRDISPEQMTESALQNGLTDGEAAYLGLLYELTRLDYMSALTDDVARVLGRKPIHFDEFTLRNAACWRTQESAEGAI